MRLNLIFPLLLTLVISPGMAQEAKRKSSIMNKNLRDRLAKIPVFDEDETSIKNPFELRDPFKRKTRKSGTKEKAYTGFLVNGKYSNLPEINDFPLSEIRIVGVLLGKERRAIAKVMMSQGKVSDDSYMIKEGMTLGENNAEVKAIVPGGIVLVEKIRNVYDQDEYIETVIPVFNQVEETPPN